MQNKGINKQPVDKWLIEPISRFMKKSSTSGIILFTSALLAIILTNAPWSAALQDII